MSAWAKPGVKVVCVAPIESLVRDEIYTIAEVLHRDDTGRLGVVLVECLASITWENTVGGFRLSRFRPLVTKTQEQDVAKFRHLLTPSPVDAGLVPAGVEIDA